MTGSGQDGETKRSRTFSVRLGLLMASAVLVLFVSGALLTVSLVSTRTIAEAVAAPLMDAAVRDTEMRLNALFDPIRRQVVADYAAIRLGTFNPGQADSLKNAFLPRLLALPQVGSMMLGDVHGRQVLAMRYDEAAYRSPLLESLAGRLPAPRDEVRQFFTREVRPATWGDRSVWTLWSADGATVEHTWEVPLPGYDPRARPWHQAAMAGFRDILFTEGLASPETLASWTDVYTMFTTQTPGISTSVAARAPSGEVLIIAYDLLLDEIAEFTERAAPGRHGQVFVITDDGRLLGPPATRGGVDPATRRAAILRPVGETAFPQLLSAVDAWRTRHLSQPGRWSLEIDDESWWSAFSAFDVGPGRRLWIGVLLPERDLVPEVQAGRNAIRRITVAALGVAAILALLFARGFSVPVRRLAEQSRRITALDLAEQPLVRTRVTELQALSQALREMRGSLREHIAGEERARLAIQERETQLRTLMDNAPDVIVRLAADGSFVYANPALTTASGFATRDVVGRRMIDLPFAAGFGESWTQAVASVVETGKPARLEFTYPTPAGPRDFDSRLEPECDPSGRVVSVLVVSRDITERREAMQRQADLEAQLRQAQKLEAVGLLAGGVAHDFNNLLQVIGGSAALISPHNPASENAELVQAIRDAVLRASQMTRQLLVFSRRQQPTLEPLDLGEVIPAHLRMLRRMMPEGIDIRFEAPPTGVRVMADRGSLEQVLLNLCVNARDAMPGGGVIRISAGVVHVAEKTVGQLAAGAYGRIEVTDTGQGIAPDAIERIFEPFFSTKPREKGTGLGLSVVYGIVHQHHGHIDARNRPEGGAMFVVHIPLASGEPAAAPAAGPTEGGPGKGTILVAEDDNQVRLLATRVLERSGYTVIGASDGAEAVQLFLDPPQPIDLIFLDVLMPGMGGFETARRCREVKPDVPVLFASGYAAESLSSRVEVSGADVLQKPYDPGMLLAAVRGMMERGRSSGA